jgi:hypothetical protein
VSFLAGIRFLNAVSGKYHEALAPTFCEFCEHEILTAEGPGEAWGSIIELDGAIDWEVASGRWRRRREQEREADFRQLSKPMLGYWPRQ